MLNNQIANINQQLSSFNIPKKYLDIEILERFKGYAENNLAESIKECINAL